MMKLLTVAILRDIPTASTPYNYQIDLYFEKECKAKLKAVIQVDQALDICCSEGGSYAEHLYEKFAGGQNRHFVNVYQEVSCGTKCCLRRYFVYRGAPQSQIQISGPTSYSVNNCNPTSSYFDCIDNTPIPCVDGNCAEY